MISQPKNRVQAIKSKFENLNIESEPLVLRRKNNSDSLKLNKQNDAFKAANFDKENNEQSYKDKNESDSVSSDESIQPNVSYLYSDTKKVDVKKSLTRQSSDPGKKLHRSHAFRCDKSQKIGISPKRHGSCYGRSETSDFTLKMGEKKLSKERLKRLGNLLEDQMRKENFQVSKLHNTEKDSNDTNLSNVDTVMNESIVPLNLVSHTEMNESIVPLNSVPDSEVPQHILDQYAKVLKPKKKDDAMTDSGVSSETENLEEERNGRSKKSEVSSEIENSEERNGRTKKLVSQFEKKVQETQASDTNLEVMNDLAISSETMRLERKNPHLILTDTLKKALKQPLPPGPPPKKPPRTFATSPIPEEKVKEKKDTKKMLEKLEQVLEKRKALNLSSKNVYDIAEEDLTLKKPKSNVPRKEIHYLCTEILDIAQRTLLPNENNDKTCLNLNCTALGNSTLSLPYTRLSSHRDSLNATCSCNNDDETKLSTFKTDSEMKCLKCKINDERQDRFKCHLSCDCKKSEFYVQNEHIYDVPFVGDDNGIDSNDNGISAKDNENKKSAYGTLNKNFSRSLEDLRNNKEIEQNQKIYDIPCDVSRSATPEPKPKIDIEKLKRNFENDFRDESIKIDNAPLKKSDKPALITPKPNLIYKNKFSKSSENLTDEVKAKGLATKMFATETKRYRKGETHVRLSMKRDNNQLDIDKENLNRLMNEIYATVTAACNMEENKPGSFPTDNSDGSTSEDSIKLRRSLTEKRKNYVRRVSSKVAYLDHRHIRNHKYRHQTSICSYKSEIISNNPYSTFRSWKSFRASQNNLAKDKMDTTDSKINLMDSTGNMLSMGDSSDDSIDNLSIDEKTGCVDIELPFEARERGLFNICMLVGLNYMSGKAYVKSVFPDQVQVPPHIEDLVFPETLSWTQRGEWSADAQAQCYSLVLTDERGERAYGYCRRVLPEGATTCLPLCYCLIGKYRAPGFYYKVLQEIESHHGSSESEIQLLLQQLFETDFPNPGEEIYIQKSVQTDRKSYSFELNVNKSKTLPDIRRSGGRSDVDCDEVFVKDDFPNMDVQNNNELKRVTLCFDAPRNKSIKRPIEPRVDEDNLSTLLDALGAGLVMKVFGSLLLERKVIIISDKLSLVSSCMEALQGALYPFVWQQPLISTIPSAIQRDVLEAPLPILAGMLKTGPDCDLAGVKFEEGMLIDLTNPSKVLHYQGDESTILPTTSYKTLKTSLQMESIKYKDKSADSKTRNVLISEAFLRFFVDIMGDYWRYFSEGEVKERCLGKGGVVFDKEAFTKSATSKQNQYFLEWFTETAMFNHFIQNMALCYQNRLSMSNTSNLTSNSSNPTSISSNLTSDSSNLTSNSSNLTSHSLNLHAGDLVDTPLPDFYQLFEERVNCIKSDNQKGAEKNYKSAVNVKAKGLKIKLRDLLTKFS